MSGCLGLWMAWRVFNCQWTRGFFSEWWKYSKVRLWCWLHNSVNILKSVESHILLVWYVNFISTKLVFSSETTDIKHRLINKAVLKSGMRWLEVYWPAAFLEKSFCITPQGCGGMFFRCTMIWFSEDSENITARALKLCSKREAEGMCWIQRQLLDETNVVTLISTWKKTKSLGKMFSASGSLPVLGKKTVWRMHWKQVDLRTFLKDTNCNPVNLVKVKACEGLMGSPAGEFSAHLQIWKVNPRIWAVPERCKTKFAECK